ncbi:OLC1v1028845C1 [Oldenlandia corymbosa var. corymbosa]|uniref:OLC1v1028845C1 n=1 Tax=Oldenlandia corymbosa var. corymbosa TaxID=529605 RepID=A0AAV1CCN8_OLDCO|nr:OLC1v1028845C1 [Oldenlandia corymbosa var. corymbosa]
MGCVSSTLLSQDDEFSQIGGSGGAAFAHHIVYLKSTTYGLLTLDPPPPPSSPPPPPAAATTTIAPTPPPRFTLSSPPSSDLTPLKPPPVNDVINSWELMAGLDSSTPTPPPPLSKENSNPNLLLPSPPPAFNWAHHLSSSQLDKYDSICPPNGENKVVIYTTTLRGIRKTFEDCNAVRSAIQGLGFSVCERDISMDRGFREELRELLKVKGEKELVPPRVFVKGRYVGGAEEVLRLAEEDEAGVGLRSLLSGCPKLRGGIGRVCEGCGGVRFLPCFKCNGSCKVVVRKQVAAAKVVEEEEVAEVVVRCSECNENGLVLCPICS